MTEIKDTPMMTKTEYTFLLNLLNKNDIMLEYGSGSSTLYFGPHVKKYISIEHDFKWFEKIKQKIGTNVSIYHVKCFYKNNNVHCVYDNLEEREKWEPYFNMIHKIPKDRYDKILIDGRARAYCAVEVYNYLKHDGLLFIHDYVGRNKYHNIVEKYYKKINSIHSLGIFKKWIKK